MENDSRGFVEVEDSMFKLENRERNKVVGSLASPTSRLQSLDKLVGSGHDSSHVKDSVRRFEAQ